jgi:rubredoxin
MNDKFKIIIVLVCILIAGIIFAVTLTGSDEGIDKLSGEVVYIKCTNPNCAYVEEIDKADFFQMIHKEYDDVEANLECSKCGSRAYRAIKCSNCGHIFRKGTVGNDYRDRCPECGYSQIEENRKQP